MNTRFTIEEENIVAIYAEDSRETTLENILAAMPYMDEDMRQLAAAAVNKLPSHDGQRVFRKGVYLDRRGIAHREQGAVADFRHRAPVLFLSLRGQLESRFCGFEYTLSSMSFSCAGSRRNTGVFSLNIPLATPCFAPYRSCSRALLWDG